MTTDEKYMKEAIRQAKKAEALEEVPIGCVIVHEGKIIARGYNRRNTDKNTLSHAELNAIRKASKKLGDWRLEGCTMYVTLEPCQMCSGALVQSRIDDNMADGTYNRHIRSSRRCCFAHHRIALMQAFEVFGNSAFWRKTCLPTVIMLKARRFCAKN